MPSFLQVGKPTLVPPPAHILDHVALHERDGVGVYELDRLDRQLLVVVTTNLHLQRLLLAIGVARNGLAGVHPAEVGVAGSIPLSRGGIVNAAAFPIVGCPAVQTWQGAWVFNSCGVQSSTFLSLNA